MPTKKQLKRKIERLEESNIWLKSELDYWRGQSPKIIYVPKESLMSIVDTMDENEQVVQETVIEKINREMGEALAAMCKGTKHEIKTNIQD